MKPKKKFSPMDPMQTLELPQTLSLLPGYPHVYSNRRLWVIVISQTLVCLLWSVMLSYYFFKVFYVGGDISWKRAVEVMGPIGKRLNNLEKERAIWNSYLEWIEDYCTVYYGLLNYLNATVTDFDKYYRLRDFNLKKFSPSAALLNQSDGSSSKDVESQLSGGYPSEMSWDGQSEDDAQIVANLARVIANLKNCPDKDGNCDIKNIFSGSLSKISLEIDNPNLIMAEDMVFPKDNSSEHDNMGQVQDAKK